MLEPNLNRTSTNGSDAGANHSALSTLGVKAKLILAFCTMAGLTVLASGVAWYAFAAIHRSVIRITVDSMPGMAASLSSRQEGCRDRCRRALADGERTAR